MNFKDIAIIVLLVIILIILLKVFQVTKSLAPAQAYSPIESKQVNDGEVKEKSERKVKPKQKHNRILKLLKEKDSPLTVVQIMEEYNSRHKELSKGDVKYLLSWLFKNLFVNKEELEGGDEYYGLQSWFDDDNSLTEEYFNRIK